MDAPVDRARRMTTFHTTSPLSISEASSHVLIVDSYSLYTAYVKCFLPTFRFAVNGGYHILTRSEILRGN